MKKQGGFTLIELVVVIVILGILAVTAAPRFLSLQDDARDSTLNGLSGAIKGAAGIVYGKAAIKGIESLALGASDAELTIDNKTIKTAYGYPAATSDAISPLVDGIGSDFKFITHTTGTTSTPGTAYFGIDKYTRACVEYTEATSGAAATVKVLQKGDTNVGVCAHK